ncbi:MAG: beta-lactamase family protein [Proteobacteria bacterium]|nr:beta-lactamase family protein [Pseudomonadota bacterium]
MTDKGMNAQHLGLLHEVVREDVRAGRYHGAVIKVGRGGQTVFEAAIGSADAAQTQPLRLDSVFSIFSVTKAFTNLLVLRAIEQGRFGLTTPISELIPEFSGHGREKDPHVAPAVAPGGISHHLRGEARLVHQRFRRGVGDRHRRGETRRCALREGVVFAAGEPCADGRGAAAHRSPAARLPAAGAAGDPGSAADARHGRWPACGPQATQSGSRFPRQLSHRAQEPQRAGSQWRVRGRAGRDALGGRGLHGPRPVPLRGYVPRRRLLERHADDLAGHHCAGRAQSHRRQGQ